MRWSATLGAIAMALGIIAVVALVHLLHGRRRTAGMIGGGVGIIGLAFFGTATGIWMSAIEIATSNIARVEKDAVVQRLLYSNVGAVAWIGGALMAVGFLLLAANLYTAR